MKLRDYIISYKKEGRVVADLFDYYERFIKPLDKAFERYSYGRDKLVLCFFKEHDDINPSMGYMRHRTFKDVVICHCLGCGRTADIVRLHQIIEHQYHNRRISEDEACRELAKIYDIPIEEEEIGDEDYEKMHVRNMRRVDSLSKRYSVRDYSRALLDIRKSGVDLEKVNSECVKMIATEKQLYD